MVGKPRVSRPISVVLAALRVKGGLSLYPLKLHLLALSPFGEHYFNASGAQVLIDGQRGQDEYLTGRKQNRKLDVNSRRRWRLCVPCLH